MYIMCIYRASADSAKIHSVSQNYRQVRIKYRTRNGMAKAGERCLARIFRVISWWIRGIWWWFFKGAFLGEFMRFESRVFDEKINGNMDDLCFLSRSEVPSEIGRAAFSARWWQARPHVSCPKVWSVDDSFVEIPTGGWWSSCYRLFCCQSKSKLVAD